jgi:hypothetical protein
MKTRPSHHSATVHEAALAAATAITHHEPHAVDAPPQTLELTAAQKERIRALHFLSSYEITHLRKVSPDVAGAFDGAVLSAVEGSPELGGPARAARIRELIALHDELSDIAAIVAPIARLVGQNLMATDAELARHAGEPLKVAHGLHKSRPDLLEQLAALDRWTRAHHHHNAPAASRPTSPTPPPASAS